MKDVSKRKIISFLNQKGGAGKTTMSTNIARCLQLRSFKILLVDSDPQGSARDWNEISQGEMLSVIGLDRESLSKDIEAVADGYDVIIIDGAPQIAKLSVAAVKVSDLVIIPVQPSPYDIWACADLIDIIKSRQEINNQNPQAMFLINRAIKNTKLETDIKLALKDYELPLIENYTTQRVSYPTTAAQGKTVFESTDQKAIDEVQNITDEILRMLRI